jgi:hypothetical protein
MMNVEDQIWDYIDGVCSDTQKQEIETKIANDISFRKVYKELKALHTLMDATDLDEPSMSFTRNVMEQVNLEIAPISLKTKVDNRIIYSIAAFFILSMLSILIYALANTSFSTSDFKMPSINVNVDLDIDASTKKIGLQIFFFVDIILGLVYLDKFLRKKMQVKTGL